MKVDIRLTAYVNDKELPRPFEDPTYLEEVLRENIEEVFAGAAISNIEIEWLVVDKQES